MAIGKASSSYVNRQRPPKPKPKARSTFSLAKSVMRLGRREKLFRPPQNDIVDKIYSSEFLSYNSVQIVDYAPKFSTQNFFVYISKQISYFETKLKFLDFGILAGFEIIQGLKKFLRAGNQSS